MLGFILTLLVTALSLLIVARLGIGVEIEGASSALIAALVLGLLNAVLRPVLGFIFAPLTFLTLGLFALVLNALILWLAAQLVDGFRVRGFLSALLASVLISLLNLILFAIIPG
jgi:putative membrane protein